MTPTISLESPDQPDVLAEMRASDEWYAATYPAESINTIDLPALLASGVAFFAARDETGRLLGFGAVLDRGDYAEIKRMYVSRSARGLKIGRRILDRLEEHARARGFTLMRLETGTRQPEALSLYRSHGYREIPPFGEYTLSDPYSRCFEKQLDT